MSAAGASPPGHLDVRKTLRPGERGTRKLVELYGNELVAVRCHHDEAAGVRLKRAEIVAGRAKLSRSKSIPSSALVYATVEPWVKLLHEKLKKGGARWDPGLRLWPMRYETALVLALRRRILKSLPKFESGHRCAPGGAV